MDIEYNNFKKKTELEYQEIRKKDLETHNSQTQELIKAHKLAFDEKEKSFEQMKKSHTDILNTIE